MVENERICPFCLKKYDDIYELIDGKVVIDNVFVHYDSGEYIRICPMPNSYSVESITVSKVEKTVEVVLGRPKRKG